MCACVVAINAFSVGLLAVSAQIWEGTGTATTIKTTFFVLQLVSLCGESQLGAQVKLQPAGGQPCDLIPVPKLDPLHFRNVSKHVAYIAVVYGLA